MKNQSRQVNYKKKIVKKPSRLFIAHASSLVFGEKNISRGQNERVNSAGKVHF